MRHLLLSLVALVVTSSSAAADTTPQTLPFTQNWTNTGLITANDDWSGVPGIQGYLGQNLTTATGVDPQTVLADSTVAADVDAIANQTTPDTLISGGVAEFEITDPTVALQGSGTADAPYLLLTLDTTGAFGVRITYNVRDVDGSGDDAIQKVALQYRVGTTGAWTNVAAGYVSDATTVSTATQVTAVSVLLPSAIDNQAAVQLRIISANAAGNDEWVGIDDISVVDDPTPPTATGTATPASALRGASVSLTATVTPGTVPASTGLTVTCDLTSIGGSATQALFDDGTNGDPTAGDNIFSFGTTVASNTSLGAKALSCSVADAEARSGTFSIALDVIPLCGDGAMEGGETCDDGNTTAGDGCSATCTVESGYTCAGSPSSCTDINECTDMTDNCDTNATCTNTPGTFTCACNSGYTGNGVTCTDVDECAAMTDTCDTNAACANTAGNYTCVCMSGFTGNGMTCTDVDECTMGTDNCDANATCANTPGTFTCTCAAGYSGNGTMCMPNCGDGQMIAPEACDDGDMADGDGCSMNCAIETGYTCTGTPSMCRATCGDGMRVGAEQCDDSNTDADDGCSASCTIEQGFTCTGTPSVCEAPDDGGCCSSSTHPGSVALLMLFVMVGLRRRKHG